MSAFLLKLAALISMLTDHCAIILYLRMVCGADTYMLLRGIGRLAFPIFCFMLVNGWTHSSDRRGYAFRLMGFACLSQLPFTLAFTPGNSFGAVPGKLSISLPGLPYVLLCVFFILMMFITEKKFSALHAGIICLFTLLPGTVLSCGSILLLDSHMNVYYTLASGLMLICLSSRENIRELGWIKYLLCLAGLLAYFLIVQQNADYGFMGLLLIFLLWVFRDSRPLTALWIVIWSFMEYGAGRNGLILLLFSCLSALPIMLYSGRKGPSCKYFFYAFYPIHLLVLGILNTVL